MSAVFLPSDLRQAASPLHACVLVGPVRLTVCSRGSVMSDAVLVSEGGWERAWEVLAEAPAPGESWGELARGITVLEHLLCAPGGERVGE